MRIGLYHEPVHTDGPTFDTYGPYARYVLEFARHFERVTVFAPATTEPTYFSGCRIDAPNVHFVPLPFFMTHAQAYRHARSIARAFRHNCDGLDIVECRATAPMAYLLWWMTRRRRVPFIYQFASDPFELIDRSPKYRGLRRWPARAAYSIEFAIQKYIMRSENSYSFARGSGIAERLRRYTPRVEAVVSSTLTTDDYHLREDSCRGPLVRLLYVGYLREGKGLDDLLDATAMLRTRGRAVALEIAGDGELMPQLQQQAHRLGIEAFVRFHGYVRMGPALNELYDSSDVFVLPSLSEGSPRVVLEAMGHSLPVVATAVGNIEEQLDGGRRGVLIPQKDPAGLAAGIERLMDDASFRQQCIQEGYRYAREHGLDVMVARIAAKACEMVRESRRRSRQ